MTRKMRLDRLAAAMGAYGLSCRGCGQRWTPACIADMGAELAEQLLDERELCISCSVDGGPNICAQCEVQLALPFTICQPCHEYPGRRAGRCVECQGTAALDEAKCWRCAGEGQISLIPLAPPNHLACRCPEYWLTLHSGEMLCEWMGRYNGVSAQCAVCAGCKGCRLRAEGIIDDSARYLPATEHRSINMQIYLAHRPELGQAIVSAHPGNLAADAAVADIAQIIRQAIPQIDAGQDATKSVAIAAIGCLPPQDLADIIAAAGKIYGAWLNNRGR